MSADGFSRALRLALIDLARGTRIRSRLPELKRSQWLSCDRLQIELLKSLKGQLRFSVEHIPYYQNLLTTCGPKVAEIEKLADLERFPVTTKEAMRRDPDAFRPAGRLSERILKRSTGGSTGDPFSYDVGVTAFSAQWAAILRAWSWCGYRFGDKMVTVGGRSLASRGRGSFGMLFYDALRGNTPLPASAIDSAGLSDLLKRLRGLQPFVIYGYPSLLSELAGAVVNGAGVSPSETPLARCSVITTSEMLFPRQRELIADAFGVPVFDMYGCNEVNLVTCECPEHQGYHVAMECCHVEILDNQDRPVPNGDVGRIVATGLLNRAMAFVRYDTGDLGALDDSPCACGRGLVRIRNLEGRRRDLVRTPDGRLIHGVEFNRIVLPLPWVGRYQVVQVARGRLVLNIATAGTPRPDQVTDLECRAECLCGMQVAVVLDGPFVKTRGSKTRVVVSQLEDNDGA